LLFDGAQVISQIRANQLIQFRNKKLAEETYFKSFTGIEQTIRVRSDKKIPISIGSARLHLFSHGKNRFVIALKYEGEKNTDISSHPT
jgi:hypothetical protein